MVFPLNSKNKTDKTRDIDGSLYLFGAVLAGLILFLVLLVGSMSSTKTEQTHDDLQPYAIEGLNEPHTGSDIGYID